VLLKQDAAAWGLHVAERRVPCNGGAEGGGERVVEFKPGGEGERLQRPMGRQGGQKRRHVLLGHWSGVLQRHVEGFERGRGAGQETGELPIGCAGAMGMRLELEHLHEEGA